MRIHMATGENWRKHAGAPAVAGAHDQDFGAGEGQVRGGNTENGTGFQRDPPVIWLPAAFTLLPAQAT